MISFSCQNYSPCKGLHFVLPLAVCIAKQTHSHCVGYYAYMYELVTYFRKVCIQFWHVNSMCIRGEITPDIILKSSGCYNFVCKPGINTRPLDSGSGNVHALWTVNCFRRWSLAVFSSSSVQPRSGEPIRFWLTE